MGPPKLCAGLARTVRGERERKLTRDVRLRLRLRHDLHTYRYRQRRSSPFRARELQPCFHTQVAKPCGAEVAKTLRSFYVCYHDLTSIPWIQLLKTSRNIRPTSGVELFSCKLPIHCTSFGNSRTCTMSHEKEEDNPNHSKGLPC